MKNLNEPRKRDRDLDQDITPAPTARNEPEVVQFQRRDNAESEGTKLLLPKRQLEELRSQWTTVQTGFVDQPRKAVEDADKLVNDAINHIEEALFAHRANLERHWKHNDQVSTEDLRVSLQRYREFFDRLVAITG